MFPIHLNKEGGATLSFDVIGQAWGYGGNGEEASVALPSLYYRGGGPGPMLSTNFDLSGAARYDWSSFPPIDTYAGIRWVQTVTGGVIPSRIAVGIDHADQSSDDRNTFIAGALIGLAGAALIAALQEGLYAPRRRETDLEPPNAPW